jgi:hypothetical protein
MKRNGIFMCISHDGNRHERYLKQAGVEWESIEIVKIYRPTVERESKIIREEFVSKEVLDKIEDLSRVTAEREDEESPWVITPYEDMPKFRPRVKQPQILNPEGGRPDEIKCHYVYICKKPFIPTPEPSEIEEEEQEEEENAYRY